MNTDIATQLISARAASTQQQAMIAIVKKNHEMQMSLISMLDDVARAAPPPGQGTRVDKLA
jgi:hypothetical protein